MAYTDIDKSDDYFNTKLYSGDNATNQAVTGVGFKPDLVWIKARTEVHQHNWFDVIRGVNKNLVSNSTNAEATNTLYGYLASYDTDGFTTQKGSSADQWNVNKSGENYVAWNWLAGGTAVSNTDGSITSSVSANTTAGFSIATFTAPASPTVFDIGHGLGGKPDMMITKAIDGTSAWWVWHIGLGDNTTDFLSLNTTNAENSVAGMWGTVGAGTSTFGYTAGASAYGGIDNVAYFFKSIKGFSKFGSYTGNGSTNGTFIYTGMKPSFVLIKRTDSTSDWVILDNKRDSFNLMNKKLFSNNSDSEYSGQNACDFLSNGIKFRDNATNNFATNISGASYIYMAFASEPFTTSTAIPCTAR